VTDDEGGEDGEGPAQKMTADQASVKALLNAKSPPPLHTQRKEKQHHYSYQQEKQLTANTRLLYWALQKLGVLANSHRCPRCGQECHIHCREHAPAAGRCDQWRWRCLCSKTGSYTKSMRLAGKGYFSNIKEPLTFVDFVYKSFCGDTIKDIGETLGIDPTTATSWRKQLQEVCEDMNRHVTKLGGGRDGAAVEFDVTYFGHNKSRKSYGGKKSGALRSKGHSVAVVKERGSRRVLISSTGNCENKRDMTGIAATDIAAETCVITDAGAALGGVAGGVGGPHLTVNHSITFVDGVTGVHTNSVESVNKQFKEFLKRQGRSFALNDKVLWSNIAQYTWQQWFTDSSVTMKFGMFFLGVFDQWGFTGDSRS